MTWMPLATIKSWMEIAYGASTSLLYASVSRRIVDSWKDGVRTLWPSRP